MHQAKLDSGGDLAQIMQQLVGILRDVINSIKDSIKDPKKDGPKCDSKSTSEDKPDCRKPGDQAQKSNFDHASERPNCKPESKDVHNNPPKCETTPKENCKPHSPHKNLEETTKKPPINNVNERPSHGKPEHGGMHNQKPECKTSPKETDKPQPHGKPGNLGMCSELGKRNTDLDAMNRQQSAHKTPATPPINAPTTNFSINIGQSTGLVQIAQSIGQSGGSMQAIF